ncbi:MAG TPA: electron transfer flavoprotein subunit beta/FixA family protein [Ignavibacteria bacterium]|nr:electron transfer flavoprotein subunit beta/FixA family protein [Ignavibacteria bacterium]
MKIIVCVSIVPDSTTKVKISENGRSIDSSGVSYILNPYDEFAVEEALKLKEKNGGEVIAVAYGTDRSKEALKKSFQMGADKGVLIKSADDNFDSYTVAKNLSEYIKDQNADVILFGKQSIDFDGLLVPSMVSEILNLPCISVVVKLEIDNGKVKAEREIEGGKEIVESSLPVIIGAQKGLNEPRYPNLKSIMAAKSKPIEEVSNFYSGNKADIIDMKLPPAKSGGKIFTNGKEDIPELVRLLREEAKVI